MIVLAKLLRSKNELEKVPDDRPGWYRFWAREAETKILLDSEFLAHKYFDELVANLRKGDGDLHNCYYIYTGIAVKESIRKRLNWHVNQIHKESTVKHGTLSTLRQTLSSLIAGDQHNEQATNNIMDKLMVEYFVIECDIKSPDAKISLETNEDQELKENVIPLNLSKNKRSEIIEFKDELSLLRTQSKRKL